MKVVYDKYQATMEVSLERGFEIRELVMGKVMKEQVISCKQGRNLCTHRTRSKGIQPACMHITNFLPP